MGKDKPRVYWDSSVFIAWLDRGSKRTREEWAGLESVAEEIQTGKYGLITSVATKIEVLYINGNVGAQELFRGFLMRADSATAVVDDYVADKAADLRTQLKQNQNRKLGLEDAIHAATAITYKVRALHTFDDHLLRLNGDALVGWLTIEKPRADQLVLPISQV